MIRAFGGVRVTAVVQHQHAQSQETAAAEHEQEQDQAVSAVTDATTDGDGAKNLAYLPPLKYIITFPPPSSSSTCTSTSKETFTTLLQTIANDNDPTATVEIQCLRPLLPGDGGLGQQTALSDAEWQELGDLVDGIGGLGEGGVGVDGDEDGDGDGKKVDRRRRIVICKSAQHLNPFPSNRPKAKTNQTLNTNQRQRPKTNKTKIQPVSSLHQ